MSVPSARGGHRSTPRHTHSTGGQRRAQRNIIEAQFTQAASRDNFDACTELRPPVARVTAPARARRELARAARRSSGNPGLRGPARNTPRCHVASCITPHRAPHPESRAQENARSEVRRERKARRESIERCPNSLALAQRQRSRSSPRACSRAPAPPCPARSPSRPALRAPGEDPVCAPAAASKPERRRRPILPLATPAREVLDPRHESSRHS